MFLLKSRTGCRVSCNNAVDESRFVQLQFEKCSIFHLLEVKLWTTTYSHQLDVSVSLDLLFQPVFRLRRIAIVSLYRQFAHRRTFDENFIAAKALKVYFCFCPRVRIFVAKMFFSTLKFLFVKKNLACTGCISCQKAWRHRNEIFRVAGHKLALRKSKNVRPDFCFVSNSNWSRSHKRFSAPFHSFQVTGNLSCSLPVSRAGVGDAQHTLEPAADRLRAFDRQAAEWHQEAGDVTLSRPHPSSLTFVSLWRPWLIYFLDEMCWSMQWMH